MTEHKHPGHFPEHLRPYLLPIPETQAEALVLLLEWHRAEVQMRRRRAAEKPDRTCTELPEC